MDIHKYEKSIKESLLDILKDMDISSNNVQQNIKDAKDFQKIEAITNALKLLKFVQDDNAKYKQEKVIRELLSQLESQQPNKLDNKEMLTADDMMELYGFTKRQLETFRGQKINKIPFSKIGKTIRYPKKDLEKWLLIHRADFSKKDFDKID
jgi:hypothetical protein